MEKINGFLKETEDEFSLSFYIEQSELDVGKLNLTKQSKGLLIFVVTCLESKNFNGFNYLWGKFCDTLFKYSVVDDSSNDNIDNFILY